MTISRDGRTFAWRGLTLEIVALLIDGAPTDAAMLDIADDAGAVRLTVRRDGLDPAERPQSIGLRVAVRGADRYLRNGYQSWDGSWFVAPGTAQGDAPDAKSPTLGFAMTALLDTARNGALVLGFTRHDRFQSLLRFSGPDPLVIDIETLTDGVAHDGTITAEPLVLLAGDGVEAQLGRWSQAVAADSPRPPRVPERRITGWCSWYNHYAAIDEGRIRAEIASAAAFRDRWQVPLDVFLIDDGFTPEMGDWLDVKPQFPNGVAPLLAEAEAAGFIPGLWIAPFLVGNRSRLFADHPDWVVRDRATGGPLVHMRFYGEFRWHKRSEEYYVLDVTHPGAEAHIRSVFRTWRRDWGMRYVKTDFMNAGSEYGPEVAAWHEPGLSRIAIWQRMAALIREEIGDALWLGCGCPLWASVGHVDAVRIGRDVGVLWRGEQSAESLLRDQLTRNHANRILWQSDPDCLLLRDRFHELSDGQVGFLARFAGMAGGVLMSSDTLADLPEARQRLFAELLSADIDRCAFPDLGRDGPVFRQIVRTRDGAETLIRYNGAGVPAGGLAPHEARIEKTA